MADAASLAAFQRRRRRRERQNVTAFDGDVASPFDLGTIAAGGSLPNSYTMPANARLAVSHSDAVAAGDITLDLGAIRTESTPALAADAVRRLGWLEKGKVVTVNTLGTLPAGTLTLYLVHPIDGRAFVIATGTIT